MSPGGNSEFPITSSGPEDVRSSAGALPFSKIWSSFRKTYLVSVFRENFNLICKFLVLLYAVTAKKLCCLSSWPVASECFQSTKLNSKNGAFCRLPSLGDYNLLAPVSPLSITFSKTNHSKNSHQVKHMEGSTGWKPTGEVGPGANHHPRGEAKIHLNIWCRESGTELVPVIWDCYTVHLPWGNIGNTFCFSDGVLLYYTQSVVSLWEEIERLFKS